ncbi:MAG: hypothetical protein A0129_05885 [Limnobacter sp. CACIAM 66H1]|uniref:hypothetical protein n=1 Tax=Limnobacter sp. CACIAM 66H1 TaxID=1813033 RepID=UPI0007A80A40|nr:hypothetical protein [Limnobacter sp. CACIAM 66H1]KYP11710.1 MAG: hypothetical protein A0129_05885 [Limnobacter sp. CACIAM 66H1]
MSKSQRVLSKGPKMEELLRSYFLKAGYYVVRSVPFVYEGFDVTDIDLWLYSRTSSVSREIALVDAKNKKTPQAIERIFWIRGLRIATKATNAIVATTDRRQEVKNFGRDLGVLVLDGTFLGKLANSDEPNETRLSDEEFFSKINEYSLSKLDGDWRGRIVLSKSLLAKSLSFDSCNEWLGQGKFFAEQSITKGTQRETALRCLYLLCSFVAIAVDYCMKELSFHEQSERSLLMKDGFTYGSRGSSGFKKVLNVAMGLVEEHANDGLTISRQVRSSVEKQLTHLNTAVLGDFFSKNEVARTLFTVAREFEQLAMKRDFNSHESASVELRSTLFCLLDYWGIDRVLFSPS